MAGENGGNTPEVELDDEAKRLRLEAVKAEARKQIAEAQQAALAAQLPASDVKAPEGEVEVGEKVGLVAEVVAYGALRDVAAQVAAAVDDAGGAGILVVDDRSLFATDWPHAVVTGELAGHLAALKAAADALEARGLAPPAVPPPAEELEAARFGTRVGPLGAVTAGVTTAQAVAGGVAGIAAMLRPNYAISAREVTIRSGALVAAVAGHLAAKRAVVVDGFELAATSNVLADFETARAERRRLEHARIAQEQRIAADATKADALRRRIAHAAAAHDKALVEETEGVDSATLAAEINRLQTLLDGLEAALTPPRTEIASAAAAAAQFDAFATAVTAAPAGGGYPSVVAAALRERLYADGDRKVAHVLYVSVDAAGAETVTIRSLFRRKLRSVGGLHVSYLLLDVTADRTVKAGSAAAIRQLTSRLRDGEFQQPRTFDLYSTTPGT